MGSFPETYYKLIRNSYIHHFINVIIKVNTQKRLFKEQGNLLDTKDFTGLDTMQSLYKV